MKNLLMCLLALIGFTPAVVSQSAEALVDGSFEAGTPNASWAETSTNFSTPLCDMPSCGNCAGPCAPNTGSWYAWFGGTADIEEGTLEQDFTIPSTATDVTLTFWVFMPVIAATTNDSFRIVVDNATSEFAISNSDSGTYKTAYVEKTLDFSAYADGNTHSLLLWGKTLGPTVTNILVDDVSLSYTVATGLVRDLLSEGIRIQPNPAKDELMVVVSTAREHDMTAVLLNVSGQQVSMNLVPAGTTGVLRIPVSALSNGTYILKMNDGRSVLTETILVSH